LRSRSSILFIFAALAVGVSACGGGGSAGSSCGVVCGGAPATQPPDGIRASGVVVDHDTGVPIAGAQVGLAPWIAGAAPQPQGTTDPNGRFTVTAPSPGEYLLVIGSDSPADPNNRATIHDAVAIAASGGVQPLVAPTMPAVPHTTPNPIEQRGNFRLATMNADEQACFAYENTKRASLGYTPVIEDEWLLENVRMAVQQEINGGGVGGGGVLTNYNGANGLGCVPMIDNDFLVSTNMGSSSLVWFSGGAVSQLNGAVDEGMPDPRYSAKLPWP
jgi:hypothetical protein